MARKKDETVIGFTGGRRPKPRTAKQQHELEKKRRDSKHLGPNIGGVPYTPSPRYYVAGASYENPRTKTFREFVEEARIIKDSF
jgi:hypothetical protein